MPQIIITQVASSPEPVEVVERKGVGHPDTICDALAEGLSRALCTAYRSRLGRILHHNVDKALLCGGRASPAFRGGRLVEPIDIYLAGRATANAGAEAFPLADIAVEGARAWLREHLHGLDAERHVRVHPRLRPGSVALQDLFQRGEAVPRSNDTSIGVGYAPLSALERLVLAVEQAIVTQARPGLRPAWGEDVKVMGVRTGDRVQLTVSCAMVGAWLDHVDAYMAEKTAVEVLARKTAERFGFDACSVVVNAADAPERGDVYLTVTGTSAESGDDGQVGRGNRVNGLITPGRPMSLEAAAGKNPVTHVGKIYNVAARDIARSVAAALPEAARVECLLVSRIGAPITEPAVAEVRLHMSEGAKPSDRRREVDDAVLAALARLPERVEAFIAGLVNLY